MKKKFTVMFLCTGNSCRSQMAEGLARHYRGEDFDAYSAGTAPQTLNPDAVIVMRELGIDISQHYSKDISQLGDISFDYLITVCGEANEACPVWPGRGEVIHRGFDDPPRLAKGAKTEEERLAPYRRVRDEIKEYILSLSFQER